MKSSCSFEWTALVKPMEGSVVRGITAFSGQRMKQHFSIQWAEYEEAMQPSVSLWRGNSLHCRVYEEAMSLQGAVMKRQCSLQ